MKASLFLAALALCASATAQQLDYRYAIPTQGKVITAKTGSVDILKAPKAKAPTLWFGCLNETDDCTFMWSNAKQPDYEASPYQLSDEYCIYTTAESGNFYRVQPDELGESITGYVAKAAVKEVPTEDVQLSDLTPYGDRFIVIDHGPYKGLVICFESDEAWGIANLMLGSIEQGKLLFTHRVCGRFNFSYFDENIDFEYGEEENFLTFGKTYAKIFKSEYAEMYVFDVNKLDDEALCVLLKKLGAEENPDYLNVWVKKDGDIVNVCNAAIDTKTPVRYERRKLSK